jgi:hypothetical protein
MNGDGGPSVCLRICSEGRGGGNRAAVALDAVTASFCRLLADVPNKLVEMKANRDVLRHGRRQWRIRVKHTLID